MGYGYAKRQMRGRQRTRKTNDLSLPGLRFPASDIRALYQRTETRWVPARDYQPVPLKPRLDPQGRPFDLSLSRFRSVSPIHRLYQKNIGFAPPKTLGLTELKRTEDIGRSS